MLEPAILQIIQIIAGVFMLVFTGLIWSLKQQANGSQKVAEALKLLSIELKKLGLSIQYCPTNRENHDKIKNKFI